MFAEFYIIGFAQIQGLHPAKDSAHVDTVVQVLSLVNYEDCKNVAESLDDLDFIFIPALVPAYVPSPSNCDDAKQTQ